MLIEMWRQDASYRISLESIGLGDKKQRITGVPLTTENIIEASEFVHTTAGGNNNIDRGFLSLAAKKSTEVNKILEPYFSGQKSWETEKYMDPLSGKEKIRIKLPDDVNRIMKGESKVEEEGKEPEGEFVQEKDPETGRMKTVWKPKKTPTQKMKDLEEKGFERKPIVPEEEEEEELTVETPITRISPEKEKENSKDLKKKDRGESTLVKEENMGVQSSTDYVYDYLNKQGFISDKGKLFIPHKTSKKINKIDSGIPEISNDLQAPRLSWANVIWDDNGIATFHNGFTMVAPRW
jgi:DNA segregation ATPase FtsK/SpoIIIE-like protein